MPWFLWRLVLAAALVAAVAEAAKGDRRRNPRKKQRGRGQLPSPLSTTTTVTTASPASITTLPLLKAVLIPPTPITANHLCQELMPPPEGAGLIRAQFDKEGVPAKLCFDLHFYVAAGYAPLNDIFLDQCCKLERPSHGAQGSDDFADRDTARSLFGG